MSQPTLKVYHCKFRSGYSQPWFIVGNSNDAFCYYEYKADCWEFTKSLARKCRGIAVLYNKDGDEIQRICYCTAEKARSLGPYKRRA